MTVLIIAVTMMTAQYVILMQRMKLSLGAKHFWTSTESGSSGADSHLTNLDRLRFGFGLTLGNASTAVPG